VKIIKRLAFAAVNKLMHTFGYELAPLNAKWGGYIDATETIRAASQRGQSVCEYIESLWGVRGWTDRVVEEMGKAGSLAPCDRVCEIGPGTGRYLERVLKRVSPRQYDIYEIADGWATWLAETYAPVVARQPADGRTLQHTPDESCGLVHAHGLFTYLRFLCAFEYFAEIARVCAPGGYVVFDFFSDQHFDADVISRWLDSSDRHPVILPRKTVLEYFNDHGFDLIHEFENKYGHSYSHYVVLRKAV
jgi:ubiquinone/menaquinone biosynthesis C-methylase UbiE